MWPWIVVGGVVVAILLVVVYLVWVAPGALTPTGRPYYPYYGGFFLVFLLVWVGFFALRMALWRGYRGRYGYGGPRRDPAVLIARQRYARGEISREQFEQIVGDLRRGRSGP